MKKKQLTKNRYLTIIVLSLTAVIMALIVSSFGLFKNLQLKTVNTFFYFRGPSVPSDTNIVIIALDDQTIKSMPAKMPYPRSYYARLVQNLSRAGARLVVFDIEFTEPSVADPREDLYLADAIYNAKNVILAGKVVLNVNKRIEHNAFVIKPIDTLLAVQPLWGIVNVPEDIDGFIRSYLLYQPVGQTRYYPLAIQAVRALQDNGDQKEPLSTKNAFIVGDTWIPKVLANTMYINFRGPAGTIRTYSLASVLDDESFDLVEDEDTDIFEQHLAWGTFRNKIVFIGSTAEELQDNKFTPFFEYRSVKQKMPGVELHANALSTILRRDFLRDMNFGIVLCVVLVAAIVTGIMTLSLRPFRAFAAVIVLIVFILLVTVQLFSRLHLILPVTIPVVAVSFSFVMNLISQIIVEQREKKRIRQTFQQYVAPAVVEKMLSSGELPSYGGERIELTVLFSDIRNFTRFSESHEPEFVVSRLSDYLSRMVEVIFKYNGTLDKFVGDEIMALFGAPYFLVDHADRACRTALEMVAHLRAMQKTWSENGESLFNIGIGINTGKVIVGNLGSKQLFDYTVIGDQVNIGARLEGANKEYGTTIIISENTYERVKESARVRELDRVRLLGRSKPIRIFELRGMEPLAQIEQDYIIDVYSLGLTAYRERHWAEALKQFRRVLRYFPTDGPSRVYIKRCLYYLEQPVPFTWDGIFEMKQK
ncbi:CHASE2 domain-containing protein [candidate division KSB1 bacterium]|nr:CHASE2 domain-containing protein [candidate division KSB1 bacterium]